MDKPTDQVWLPIPGWEDLYEVSDQGLVWSTWRKGRILRASPGTHGYLTVHLSHQGVAVHHTVHSLVARAFIGPRPTAREEIRHLDGNPCNNRASNLAYGTSENKYDTVRHGQHHNANKTCCPRCGSQYATRINGGRICRTCEATSDAARRKRDPEHARKLAREAQRRRRERLKAKRDAA